MSDVGLHAMIAPDSEQTYETRDIALTSEPLHEIVAEPSHATGDIAPTIEQYCAPIVEPTNDNTTDDFVVIRDVIDSGSDIITQVCDRQQELSLRDCVAICDYTIEFMAELGRIMMGPSSNK